MNASPNPRPAILFAVTLGAVAAAALALAGCTQSRLHMSPDFGVAVRQNMVAQIADPDAQYAGTPAAGSDGSRVGLAQDRYVKGKVIPPAQTSASNVSLGEAPSAPK